MTLFDPGPPVLAGVDEVLRVVTGSALGGMSSSVHVTVGPLDRPISGPRLNWFLYHVTPAPALANMEFPQRNGWTTRRGRPPLALSLHYLLSADPGELSDQGQEDEIPHAALSAVMSALHDYPIFGPDTQISTDPPLTVAGFAPSLDGLVEPLRITLEDVPVERITALWNTGSRAMRVSVGYLVSLVSVPAQQSFRPGPPVLTRIVGVSPSMGPVITDIAPSSVSFGQPLTLSVRALADTFRITLSRLRGDPDDPSDGRPDPAHTHSTGPWQLSPTTAPDGLTVTLPNAQLAPGQRAIVVTNLADGLAAGSGSAVVTVVPTVVSGPPLITGDLMTLSVEHVTDAGDAFFAGTAVPYGITSPTQITVRVPPLPPTPTVPVGLRVGTVAGPVTELAVGP